MRVIPLPLQPSIEQLRKRAREFQRAVRAGRPLPLELVAEHSPGPVDPESFTLARTQLVLVRCHGFTSWQQLLRHLGTQPAGPPTVGQWPACWHRPGIPGYTSGAGIPGY